MAVQKAVVYLLTFTISSYSKDLDRTEDDEENGDPNADVDVIPPVLNGDTGGRDFEGQDGEPIEGVVPADGETPGGEMSVDESLPLSARRFTKKDR